MNTICPHCGCNHQNAQANQPGAPRVEGLGPLTADELQDVECKATRATPGPWAWFTEGAIYLATQKWGHRVVMAFRRQGTQSAQPMFRGPDNVLVTARELNNITDNVDAAFIERLDPTTVLRMVAEVRAYRAATLKFHRDAFVLTYPALSQFPAVGGARKLLDCQGPALDEGRGKVGL